MRRSRALRTTRGPARIVLIVTTIMQKSSRARVGGPAQPANEAAGDVTAQKAAATPDAALKSSGADSDFHHRDLWEAIEAGAYPEWELGLQTVTEEQAGTCTFGSRRDEDRARNRRFERPARSDSSCRACRRRPAVSGWWRG